MIEYVLTGLFSVVDPERARNWQAIFDILWYCVAVAADGEWVRDSQTSTSQEEDAVRRTRAQPHKPQEQPK